MYRQSTCALVFLSRLTFCCCHQPARSSKKVIRQFRNPHFASFFITTPAVLSVYQVLCECIIYFPYNSNFFYGCQCSIFVTSRLIFISLSRAKQHIYLHVTRHSLHTAFISMVHELQNNTNSTLSLSTRANQQHLMYFEWEISQTGHTLSSTPVLQLRPISTKQMWSDRMAR